MQATTVSPTPAPAPGSAVPAPAPAGPITVTFTGADGATQVLTVPMTRQQVREIRAQREELSNQLTNVASRRKRVATELSTTPVGPARTGLEQRLGVLDQRIAQMESDLAATGRQLSAAPLGLMSSTEVPIQGDIPENVTAIVGIFTVFVLFPIALAMSRWIWKRTNKMPAQNVQLSPQLDQRLERLEQGVDAIAIEIERVTEGQRFVTRLLSESETREKLPVSGS